MKTRQQLEWELDFLAEIVQRQIADQGAREDARHAEYVRQKNEAAEAEGK